MELHKAIQTRFSCRAYQDREIDEATLRRILEAGRLAPSGRNLQNFKVIVVRDPSVRGALAVATDQAWVGQAPVILAVVTLVPDRVMHCGIPAGPVDCAIAIDHMSLAATGEGLGNCWIGHFDQERARKVLGVPDEARIVELLTIGYPDAKPGRKTRKDLEEIVCHDRFC